MRRYVILFAAPVMAIALAACQAETPRTITVTAAGTAEAEATDFNLSIELFARGDTREEAASAGEAMSAAIREALPQLVGLDSFDLQTTSFRLGTICAEEAQTRFGRDAGQCEPVGYAAIQTLRVSGAPATLGANAASLASELGAQSARINGYSNRDHDGLRAEAMLDAANQARARAERIAAALGVGLGQVISAAPEPFGYGAQDLQVRDHDTVTVRGFRRQPAVQMSVEPGPVTVREELTFVFQLVDAPAAPDE